jgi:hypothetical protein
MVEWWTRVTGATAIIQADVTIPVIVVRGVAPEAYITIDADGLAKTPADYFRYQNIPNAVFASAAAAYIWRYENRSKEGALKAAKDMTRSNYYETY